MSTCMYIHQGCALITTHTHTHSHANTHTHTHTHTQTCIIHLYFVELNAGVSGVQGGVESQGALSL